MSTSAIRPDPFERAVPEQARYSTPQPTPAPGVAVTGPTPTSPIPPTVTPPVAPEPESADSSASDGALEQAALEPSPSERKHPVALSFMDRVEAFIARLSTRNHFWHRVCSLIWLPYAFKSGIRMRQVSERSFSAVLPFRRFNRNWYNAMAGAALLANSEIAGGMYIFGITGGDYTIVCKHLEYKFLRPCLGPAIYNVTPREDIKQLIASGKEFNATLDLEIVQMAVVPETLARLKKKDMLLAKMASKERRVGRCVATFHVTPTIHQKAKRGDTRKVS